MAHGETKNIVGIIKNWVNDWSLSLGIGGVIVAIFAGAIIGQHYQDKAYYSNHDPRVGLVHLDNATKRCDGTTLVYSSVNNNNGVAIALNSPECRVG